MSTSDSADRLLSAGNEMIFPYFNAVAYLIGNDVHVSKGSLYIRIVYFSVGIVLHYSSLYNMYPPLAHTSSWLGA